MACGATLDHVAKPLVFLKVDLTTSQSLVQDAAGITITPFLTAFRPPPPAYSAGDQGADQPDQQGPERDHGEPHQAGLPPGPAAAPDHHHDHLLAAPVIPGLRPHHFKIGSRYL